MNLKGLKLAFLGDSITEGVGTSEPSKIYLNVLNEKMCKNGIEKPEKMCFRVKKISW